jgi:hypothetical protein
VRVIPSAGAIGGWDARDFSPVPRRSAIHRGQTLCAMTASEIHVLRAPFPPLIIFGQAELVVTQTVAGICRRNAGYQFNYVFDWTILKYPQLGSNL